LFIIIHQAYELWFKQAPHEFDRVEWDFSASPLDDEAMARIVHSLARVHEILKLLVTPLDVLETMTQADFLDFRDYLFPASGFQSLQFRLIETRLGLPEAARIQFDGEALEKPLSAGDLEQAKKDEEFKRQQYVAQQEQAKRDEDYRQQLLAQQEETEAISCEEETGN
jgi:tryptophan 2,3-dioxygenase